MLVCFVCERQGRRPMILLIRYLRCKSRPHNILCDRKITSTSITLKERDLTAVEQLPNVFAITNIEHKKRDETPLQLKDTTTSTKMEKNSPSVISNVFSFAMEAIHMHA